MRALAEKTARGVSRRILRSRPRTNSQVLDVQPDHLVEGDAAASLHLPQPGNAGFPFNKAAAVPHVVHLGFVGDGGPRPHERHLAAHDIEELRQFIQAGAAQESAEGGHPGIVLQLVGPPVPVRAPGVGLPGDESLSRIPDAPGIVEKYIDRNFRKVNGCPY